MRDMRAFLGFLLAAGIIGGGLYHKQRGAAHADAADLKPSAVPSAKAPAAAPPAQPSPHHWPKRALDRAADVKRQVADQRKTDETR